ncbi:MAG: membrane dipeptidase [Hydrogenophaga sp.]|uniref:dipeptidase n=1 Tax=Hydrogenophaga sp. TaxID=1904254 RepID=UPI0026120D37|nr:membrane dipeptidase [Hydrogenophaga sp.]MCW5668511.1 membrane dipeptidase [Hydrogenophaga sp.]
MNATLDTDVYRSSIVWDMTLPWIGFGRPELRPAVLPRLKACGYTCVSLTMATDEESLEATTQAIAHERAHILSRPDLYVLVETTDDVRRAKAQDKLAVAMHFQGTNALARNLHMVEAYYRLGIRHMLMAYNQKNAVGDGCHELTDAGLSRFGRDLVAEMNRVGMLVDVSHTGYRTSMDVIAASTQPVVFTHSNPKALWDHPRNITNDQAKASAATGGVVGVNGVGIFMGDNDASTEALYRLVAYYRDLIGAEHVGLGVDFSFDTESIIRKARSSAAQYPSGGGYDKELAFVQPEQVADLANLLLRRGFSAREVEGILGENWLRVTSQVWKALP